MTTKIEDYNAPSRRVECKLLIHFPTPLEVTQDNYLIDLDILEEAGASSSEPFGSLSSNELSVSLYNDKGLFSPTNKNSPYYGLFKQGLKIEVFFKVNEQLTWDPCGVYYVTSWQASITGTTATILANDILLDVFSKKMKPYYIKKNVPYKDFLRDLFLGVDIAATIDPDIEGNLAFAYTTTGTRDCLAKAVQAARALCTCNKQGNVIIKALQKASPVTYTLTDNDQVIDIKNTVDAISAYDSVNINISLHSLGQEEEVLNNSSYELSRGNESHGAISFNTIPIYTISNINFMHTDNLTPAISYSWTPQEVKITSINNNLQSTIGTLVVTAIPLKIINATIGTSLNRIIKVDNIYIQTNEQAQQYLALIQNYIQEDVPLINVTIRGNPLISIGDKVLLYSSNYKVSFEGIVMRSKTTYNGALSSELMLLDTSILGVS